MSASPDMVMTEADSNDPKNKEKQKANKQSKRISFGPDEKTISFPDYKPPTDKYHSMIARVSTRKQGQATFDTAGFSAPQLPSDIDSIHGQVKTLVEFVVEQTGKQQDEVENLEFLQKILVDCTKKTRSILPSFFSIVCWPSVSPCFLDRWSPPRS